MPTPSSIQLETLLIEESKDSIYDTAIGIAETIGLPVSTWQAGDPTRSLYHIEAELLATLETVIVNFIRAGFLDYATGDWLKVLADQVFGVTVPGAIAATCTVRLTNNGGGLYTIAAGDLTLKNTTSGRTYRNTTGGVLASGPGTALDITVVADDLGSEGSAAVGEIDELVTGLLGVTCTNLTPAVGVDEQDESTTRAQCRAKLDSLSPNGAKGAYSYVALNSELTGTSAITRVRVYSESDTGDVTVYLAGAAGAVAEVDRAAVEQAILDWATPLCITPAVLSASNVTVPVTYELWVYKSVNKSSAEIQEDIENALEQMFATRPIGGDIIPPATGALYHSMIESTIRGLYPETFRVTLSSPSGDTTIANNQVAALGAVSGVIHIVPDP
jgi:uncharacterized phage protein gp47/JayE